MHAVNISAGFVPDLIPKSDILLTGTDGDPAHGFWVNKGKLTALSGTTLTPLSSMPDSQFPFSRLAGISPANSTRLLVYHQLNASTFVEDEWDSSVGGWVSRHLTISMA